MSDSGALQHSYPALIRSLHNPHCWPHPVAEVQVIETHISWVLLTGDYAYKIKRPLNLGFLDFSTLDKRRDACLEELRLNHRTAPDLYQDVVAIAGSEEKPRIADLDSQPADVIEYAVRMRQFPQGCQLDRLVALGELDTPDMDALAELIAAFHERIPRAHPHDPWNGVERLGKLARENYTVLAPLINDAADGDTLERLRQWTASQLALLQPRIEQRFAAGFVRECHGDLHLSNLARIDGNFVAFDGIEFDPALRWMDVMSEVGFLVMDLAARQRIDLAWRFLNRYLELTGDYSGTATLRFFIVYGSMVRAKIAGIRSEQQTPGDTVYREQSRRFRMHFSLAERAARPRHPVVILASGLSGSGKTWITRRLCTALPGIVLRSDIERKRLHGMPVTGDGGSAPGEGIYDAAATQRTYLHLRDRARDVLAGSFDVIIDAACLTHEQRKLFIDLARDASVQFLILHCKADDAVLRSRIRQRDQTGTDASEAGIEVFEYQKTCVEDLTDLERGCTISIDTSEVTDALRVTGEILKKLGRESID